MGPIRKGVLACSQLDQNARLGLLDALGVTRQLYSSHIWGPLSDNDHTRLQAALMRGIRVIAGTPREGPRSTHDRSD
eukprot:5784161-Alexandrium_andersonii.AAC.1